MRKARIRNGIGTAVVCLLATVFASLAIYRLSVSWGASDVVKILPYTFMDAGMAILLLMIAGFRVLSSQYLQVGRLSG